MRLAYIVLIMVLMVPAAYSQVDTSQYDIHIPDMMIRGESYQGVIISETPAEYDIIFRFGAGGGDVILPETVTLYSGSNHAIFDILPVDSTILTGKISTIITVITPDGNIHEIPVETHPGVGTVSRLWIVGPGENGATCKEPADTTSAAISNRAAEGIFETPNPNKEIRTNLSETTIHLFLADRYCTPVTAPPGGITFMVSSNSPNLTFGDDSTHVRGLIPEGFSTGIIDVSVSGDGILYATGDGVSPDSISISSEPVDVEIHLGIGPEQSMESSFVNWFVWITRDGEQYVPDYPIPLYLTTNNPVLSSFDRYLIDSTSPTFEIRPHKTYLVHGVASGVLHVGTPARVGDLRVLAGDREITVTAHIPGVGTATDTFQVGIPGQVDNEINIDVAGIERCMEEEATLPDGFYSHSCTNMWESLLIASHFFDISDGVGQSSYLDNAQETTAFLDGIFGGDNTERGKALFDLVNNINEYSITGDIGAGISDEITNLFSQYLQTSNVSVERDSGLGVTSEQLERLPDEILPNEVVVEAFPGKVGTYHLVVSTRYNGGGFNVPTYIPDGIITLTSFGLEHEPEVRTYGSNERFEAPGTRPASVVIPVIITYEDGGQVTASLGGVGGNTIMIENITPDSKKRLHVSPLPGSGQRDLIAILSVVDSDGMVVNHTGDIFVEAGKGASDVALTGWRGGGGMIRGSVDGVGEIIIHAPGLGGGTALTTPVRHETDMYVWYPGMVHVAEEFPLVAHALDSDGLPIRPIQVTVAGQVQQSGYGLELSAAGKVPVIVEYEGIFHAGVINGFLNTADIRVDTAFGRLVQLNDTIIIEVDTGVMQNPRVTVSGGDLLFSGERERWVALADKAGPHTIDITVNQPGWEPYNDEVVLRVTRLFDIDYNAITSQGVRVVADAKICGEMVRPGVIHSMERNLCEVTVPESMTFEGISHELVSLTIDGVPVQSGLIHDFDDNTGIVAMYEGVIRVEAFASYSDGTEEELLLRTYAPDDIVTIPVESQYDYFGLVWDRPDKWEGLPPDAITYDGRVQWSASEDAFITIRYAQDLTYVIILGAAGLSAPVIILMREKIPFLRSLR